MHKSKARGCVPTPLIHTLHVIQLKSQNENYSVETFVTNKPHWTCFTSHTNYFRNQNNSNDYIFFWLTPGVNVSTSHCTKLDKCFIYSFSFISPKELWISLKKTLEWGQMNLTNT